MYSILLKGIQFTKLKLAFKYLKEKDDPKTGVTPFQALCINMCATLGTGNITGVAVAIALGGPGALIWMIMVAIIGMPIKYVEGYLAIRYRKKTPTNIVGGPYGYIEYGLGRSFKPLAKIFATFGLLSSMFGIGTLIQMNSIVEATNNVFYSLNNTITLFNKSISIYSLIITIVVVILTALITIGGIKKIGSICEYLVPIMGFIYITICLIIIITNIKYLSNTIYIMFKLAFNNKALLGGFVGISIKNTIQQGISKGVFTTEAGLGSSAIASSMSSSDNPVKIGLTQMLSTLLGTIIVSLLTGICVLITNAHLQNLEGIDITTYAFSVGLPFKNQNIALILILICITCFAFTTIIGWNLYGLKCLNYLTNNKIIIKTFQWSYIFILFIGLFLNTTVVWDISDILNGLMAIPNLIAITLLNKQVVKETNLYFKKEK